MTHDWYQILHDFAGPVATFVAAVVAATITFYFNSVQAKIARQQAKTARVQAELARVRLKHDLFDRRFAVFDAARHLLFDEIEVHRNVTEAGFQAYLRGIANAIFLFDDEDLQNYLVDLRKQANLLRFLNSELNRLEIGEKRTKINEEIGALMEWFFQQCPVLVAKFKPFLSLPQVF
jgi:hypothetical protein